MFTMIKIFAYCCLLSAVSIVEMKLLDINGHVRGKVEFTCSGWDTWTDVKYNDKYFCRSPCTEDKHIISKAAFGKTTKKHRVELTNSADGLFVTFSNLHQSDSGTYYCGVERLGKDSYITVNLKVTDAKSSSPKTTPKTVVGGFTLSSSATYSSTVSSDSSDIIPDVSIYTSTPPASAAQGAEMVLYLIVGAIVFITVLIVLLKLIHKKVVSSADTPQHARESAGPAGVYQSLHPVTMDEDQVYSTITAPKRNVAPESMEVDTTSG